MKKGLIFVAILILVSAAGILVLRNFNNARTRTDGAAATAPKRGAPAPAAAAPPPSTSPMTLEVGESNAEALNHLEDYPALEVLSISCVENLKTLPESIGHLTHLRELTIDNGNGCSMTVTLPNSIGDLQSLEKLVLNGAVDTHDTGPRPVKRHGFPESFSNLKNLAYLDIGHNGLEEVPSFVKNLPKLRELRFAWNMKVKEVPAFISGLPELTTLSLDADGLKDLPDSLNGAPKLSHITLGENCAITQNKAKMEELKKRFPKITFDFDDEYDDCSEK